MIRFGPPGRWFALGLIALGFIAPGLFAPGRSPCPGGAALAQTPDGRASATAPAALDADLLPDYSQWKLALPGGAAAEPVAIAAPPGFVVEVVRAAEDGEGSWISLAFDPRGRPLIGREDKGVLRGVFSSDGARVERLETINDTLLEPRGLLCAFGDLYVAANNSKTLYRLRDADGDDRFERVEALQRFEGGVGHGRNGLALGPDGKIHLALGNNARPPAALADATPVDAPRADSLPAGPLSPYRRYGLDRLAPCAWNEFLFDSDARPPAGFIARCDRDGRNWELVAGGFRNPYDLAFNRQGELFTYDADMEWDVGAPWYRPTCVAHVVPGGEHGWRQGTSVWPDHFADALPRVCDVGLGSPTGVAFGESSRFPPRWRDALFICDWAYGRVLAVHLTPRGASYAGKVETFLRGRPLNLTDVVFGPDGAMYLSVGGRGTRSAIYRVAYTGAAPEAKPSREGPFAEDPAAAEPPEAAKARARRRALEAAFAARQPDAVERLWPALGDADPYLRGAARVALEQQPVAAWRERALAENNRRAAAEALIALARVEEGAAPDAALRRLAKLWTSRGAADEPTAMLRAMQLQLIRQGPAASETRAALRVALEPDFPAASWPENQLLGELLAALDSPKAPGALLALFPRVESDVQRLGLLYMLRSARAGWTPDLRRQLVTRLRQAERYDGAHYLPRFLTYIRSDLVANFSDDERAAWAGELATLGGAGGDAATDAASPPAPRPEVAKWTLDALLAELAQPRRPADAARGRAVYLAARCGQCHRAGEIGAPLGPDLTRVAARLGPRDLLDAVLAPSRSVDEKYRALSLETSDGRLATGFLVGGDQDWFYLASDPLRPAAFAPVRRAHVTRRVVSPLSPMPEGLLNAFTADEIHDLLAFLGVR